MATCWDSGEGTGHLSGETQIEPSQNMQPEGSGSAVNLSSGIDEVQFTKPTPEGARCYILVVAAWSLSVHLLVQTARTEFYIGGVYISGSSIIILVNALKTNQRVSKYYQYIYRSPEFTVKKKTM